LAASIGAAEWQPKRKVIDTDESKIHGQEEPDASSAAVAASSSSASDDAVDVDPQIVELIGDERQASTELRAVEFEKDDDTNFHVDCIHAAANLRASVYTIDRVERRKTRRIAGRIMPAIASTTACVSGLVALELIKVAQRKPLEAYKNAFLNLALPFVALAEPGRVERVRLTDDVSITLWTTWQVREPDMTVQDFIDHFDDKVGLEVNAIFQGSRMVYIDFMHFGRLSKPLRQFLDAEGESSHVDLTITFMRDDGDQDIIGGEPATDGEPEDEDIPGPIVRFYLTGE
jgi:ubiquitin-activating enzyme E1-like protein 2